MYSEFEDQGPLSPTPPALPPSAAAINADLAKMGLICGASMLGAIAARLIPGLAVPYGLLLTAAMLGTLARASSAEEKGDRVLGAIIGGAIALNVALLDEPLDVCGGFRGKACSVLLVLLQGDQ